ncbi:MAG TPA: carboxypeptidase-like regulatory domain-containing protein [Planctomycetota bacterium]|nr:carboxypeptidase-like regulatory domain-containing protein [Planctomycetota bacterium]
MLLVLAAVVVYFTLSEDRAPQPGSAADGTAGDGASAVSGELAAPAAAVTAAEVAGVREPVAGGAPTGVRGVVLSAENGLPLGGIEVIAVADEPSIEPIVARFRGLFQQGLFVETRAPRRELGRTVSNPDGSFEITGLAAGRVFLDGRSDGWFVRTPGTARLAVGQIQEGIELRASPGGRVRGIVLGADGGPAAGAHVSLRPGPNAFFGQITERQYRWLETVSDKDGRFDLPGVPRGQGYTVSAVAPQMALEELHGLEVLPGAVTEVTLRGHQGATVLGRVVDGNGQALAAANVAMVYLDISRMLFSADGRSEPIVSDAEGRFRVEHVAAGRVAFVAAAPDLAPSNVEDLAVVDGGVYEDLVLQLGEGATVSGMVVDDQQQPVAGAAVELRPVERPNDPQFIKTMLKIRRVEATTGADGRFLAKGLTGERLVVQASKAGYTTAIKSGIALDDQKLVIEIRRGAIVRGKVTIGDEPLTRFRVDTRTTEIPKTEGKQSDTSPEGAKTDGDAAGAAGVANARAERNRGRRASRDESSGPPWANRPGMREGTMQLPEGQTMMNRGMDGNWREIQAADGTFELRGIPPGRIRVRVRADGYLDGASQEVDLLPAQTSDVLVFKLEPGQPVAGHVVDETGKPVSDAQVTAYKQREDNNRRGPFAINVDPEDFDFLGLSAATNQRSTISDSKGSFHINSLEPGRYRFTARHPDLAKSSAKDVEVKAGVPTPDVEIRLDAGGGIEGAVTGLGMRPLADALMVAFSIQAGTMRSSTTDKAGYYRIDGLPPGQYIVFKSRLDERADNIPLELMSNMRLKTATVKQGKFTRLDLQDVNEDGVRVYGIVREGPAPVPRALITLLGSDRDGVLGMGVRANAAGMDGRYELVGIKPGSYVMQVSRFQGQPVQTTFEIEVPGEARDFAYDVQLPTSSVSGRVVDTRGNPVAGLQVTLGSDQGSLGSADGLLGLIAQNGLSQARTNADGEFRMRSVAAGTYRVTAGSRQGRGLGGRGFRGGAGDNSEQVHGEASLDAVVVDGVTNVEGLVITVPLAGRITGTVVDGSGNPVASAEIGYVGTSNKQRRPRGNPLLDLIAAQPRPIRSGPDGRFQITGLTPGVYDLRVEGDALQAGKVTDVKVGEDQATEVTLHMVRGATLRVRATNVDKQHIPLGYLSLLDGQGKPVVSRISTLSVMRRLMGNRNEVEDSGWYEFGSVPPDTYTAIIAEPGKPEIRITRTILDGETVEWDVDVARELAERDKLKK